LSARRVHEETDLPLSTVYELVAKGELAAIRNGRSVRIDERDLLRWIESHKEVAR
jgi:excisionase family DNA binding protein